VHHSEKHTEFFHPLQRQGVLVRLRPEQQVFVCGKSQAMAQFMLYEDGRSTRFPYKLTSPL
jgi:hypothetical protein